MRVTWRSGHWTKASLASRSKACVSLPGRERREARYMVVRAVTWVLFTTPVLANGITWVPVLRCRSSSTALVSPGRGGRSESRRAARGRPPGWTASRSWHPESAWWRGGALYWPVKCTPPLPAGEGQGWVYVPSAVYFLILQPLLPLSPAAGLGPSHWLWPHWPGYSTPAGATQISTVRCLSHLAATITEI